MNIQLTLGLNPETLSAVNGLADAIQALANAQSAGTTIPSGGNVAGEIKAIAAQTKNAEESTGPVYWANNSAGTFGKVESEAEYERLKEGDPAIYRIPESKFKELASAKQTEEKAEEQPTKAEKKSRKAKAETKVEPEVKAAEPAAEPKASRIPSEEELIEVFRSYLPSDLTKEERAERHAFVKPLLARFGVSRATELAPEHRLIAINIVKRKMAGEDIDPASADFAEIAAEIESSDDDEETLV